MQTLRDWALTQLRTTWPAQVERMAPIALPHAAGEFLAPPSILFSLVRLSFCRLVLVRRVLRVGSWLNELLIRNVLM